MSYHGYKVPAGEVTKNDLAYINKSLASLGTHGATVPATVVKGWNDNLNTWQNELSYQYGDPTQFQYDPATVDPHTKQAVQEYTAFVQGKTNPKHDKPAK